MEPNYLDSRGAVQCVIAQAIRHPMGPDTYTLYAGAVNGGIWRCDNFAANLLQNQHQAPSWVPLSDNTPSLSISSLSLDPLDSSGNTVWAGTGTQSSAGKGGPAVGLLKTTNGTDASPSWVTLGDRVLQP